jgi:hypothetical protein
MARRAFPRWRVGVRMFAITEASFLSASAGVGSSQKDDLRCLRVCDAFPRCRTRSSASTHLTFVAHGSEPGRKPRRLSAKSADRSGPPCGQLERSQDAFQHRQRAHSTAQPSFQAPACFGHPSSLPPIQCIQMLWRGNRPLSSAWKPGCCGNHPDHGRSLSIASGSR